MGTVLFLKSHKTSLILFLIEEAIIACISIICILFLSFRQINHTIRGEGNNFQTNKLLSLQKLALSSDMVIY